MKNKVRRVIKMIVLAIGIVLLFAIIGVAVILFSITSNWKSKGRMNCDYSEMRSDINDELIKYNVPIELFDAKLKYSYSLVKGVDLFLAIRCDNCSQAISKIQKRYPNNIGIYERDCLSSENWYYDLADKDLTWHVVGSNEYFVVNPVKSIIWYVQYSAK